MSDLEAALGAQDSASEAFTMTASKVPETKWSEPGAPGKWSPAQVTDHVRKSTQLARQAMTGDAGMGGIPGWLRWLPRRFFFDKVVARGFPEVGKGPPVFAPAANPAPRPELLRQLTEELTVFAATARSLSGAGQSAFVHPFFGRIQLADYVRFIAHHLDHHRAQLPGR